MPEQSFTEFVGSKKQAPVVQSFGDFLGSQQPEHEPTQSEPVQAPQLPAQPGGMLHPNVLFPMIEDNARNLARIIIPPPVPVPLPIGLQSEEQQNLAAPNPFSGATGADGVGAALNLDPSGILPGIYRAGRGVSQISTGKDTAARVTGARETLAGGFDAATPAMVGSAIKAPIKTAVSLGAGMVSQAGVEAGLVRLGLPKHWAGLAGDVAGIVAGVGTHEVSPRAIKAIRARVEPVLQERAAKATTQMSGTANSTGAEPYRPAAEPLNPDTFTASQKATQPLVAQPAMPKEKPSVETKTTVAPVVEKPAAGPAGVAEPGGRSAEKAGPVEIKPNVFHQEGERAGKFTIERLKRGQPGISQESDPILGPDSRKTVFVARGDDGMPQGYLHFFLDDAKRGVSPPEHGLSPEIYVQPESRRQGIASSLYGAARDAGYDLSKVSGRETTPAGAAFLNRWASVEPTPEPRKPSGSVTLGSGLGALQPVYERMVEGLRESTEEVKALIAKREAGLEALERSKITPRDMSFAKAIRHYFTGERDFWAARANQVIAQARALTSGSREKSGKRAGIDTDAEAVTIMRQFKGNHGELRAVADRTHPDLAEIEDPKVKARVLARLDKLQPSIERAMNPTPQMLAVDAFYTHMAEMTGTEGLKTGALERMWNSESYVPELLNPKGEGEFPGVKKVAGQLLGGRIGKYFGFANERTYPTVLHAIMDDVIPKTLNVHDAFTVQQSHFATARATRLFEKRLQDAGIGKYTTKKNAPVGDVPLAAHSDEFTKQVSFPTGGITEEGDPEFAQAEYRLFVPPEIEKAMRPITAPDWLNDLPGWAPVRAYTSALKASNVAISLFHAATETLMMDYANGVKGWWQAIRSDARTTPEYLLEQRDGAMHGLVTAAQGRSIGVYKSLEPGSIPTWQEIAKKAPIIKQVDQLAESITRFTFDNLVDRYKVTTYAVRKAAWIATHPNASDAELALAKQDIASATNAIFGGLHFENLGWTKAAVELARAVQFAPDWTWSNVFNIGYAVPGKAAGPLRSGLSGERGRLSRAFWTRTAVHGVIGSQLASLMYTGLSGGKPELSDRPFYVYKGRDEQGRKMYVNLFLKGAPGDVLSWFTKVYDLGAVAGSAQFVAGKLSAPVRASMHLGTNTDWRGRPIVPHGLNPLAATARGVVGVAKELNPLPFGAQATWDLMAGPDADKFSVPEFIESAVFGARTQHVAPEGTHMSGGVLRPNAIREKNTALDQATTGQVYKRRWR